MTTQYVVFDTETSGLHPCFDQVLQFAGIRTTHTFEPLEHIEEYIRLRADVVPAVEAMTTHRISLKKCHDGISERQAMHTIYNQMTQPNTINMGYNNLGFDDDVLRFSFFRNLLPAYNHQYLNGCYRMDLYPITVLYHLYRPDALQWPTVNGKISLKLENLNKANNLAEGQAHNALVDVQATIALAKKLQCEEDMWSFCQSLFNKRKEQEHIKRFSSHVMCDNQPLSAAYLIHGRFGAARQFQIPALLLGTHHHYRNQLIWLRLDSNDLRSNYAPENPSLIIRKKAAEPPFALPLKERYNRMQDQDRIEAVSRNINWLQENENTLRAIRDHHLNETYDAIDNIDPLAALYELPFLTDKNKRDFMAFHQADIQNRERLTHAWDNPIHKSLALRCLANEDLNHLSQQEQEKHLAYVKSLWTPDMPKTRDYKNNPRLCLLKRFKEWQTHAQDQTHADNHALLQESMPYIYNPFTEDETR